MDALNRLFSNDFAPAALRCAISAFASSIARPPLKDLLIAEAGGSRERRAEAASRSRAMSEPRSLSPRTLAAQALGRIDERTRAIVPPIHLATTFVRDPDNLYRSGNVYGRPDNETVREAEAVIGALEGAPATLVFGSGMSAAIALFLSLGPGAHVSRPASCIGRCATGSPTRRRRSG